ncbi:amidase signature enzyme [Corynespora cassiicola Philippines]|uniref:Amidase signature enzyme n=1 Tax=Corynespora cassiicola Philippines TaxID=1448308 RepID=A0A2T2NZ35_CORCC|nr:amidase signature enzyme [Corynespora cassiicola Philippines]
MVYTEPRMDHSRFDVVGASIAEHKKALDTGAITSVELVTSYLLRIATYDIRGGLNAFTVFNPSAIDDAVASDKRRLAGIPPRALEGIPYTLKDSFKYSGLSVTNGSPALAGLMSNEDSHIAAQLREAGAILLGKTNMPPMAAGGMQRGLYGRAESPYHPSYLTAAFSSGSSNGAATSTTSSMAVFAMGSETVSSGRSPASNNALVAYTPSRGVLSCRGLWPLYVTCDVPVPYARSVADLLAVLAVIAGPDQQIKGDFWREQSHVRIPTRPPVDYASLAQPEALRGRRIGVPKLYVGQKDSDPHAKPVFVSPEVIELWNRAAADLASLGAEVVYTDFPLVTNYENDSVSGEANNVTGAPSDWNHVERSTLIAKAWNDFLVHNNDPEKRSLADVDANLLFPKPEDYIPDTFIELRNWITYSSLPSLASELKEKSIFEISGLAQALQALEAQRKRDLEDWMDALGLDCLAFPANGDIGYSDLEFNLQSTTHSLQNGIKYSNGNRAIRHLGVPTVSVPMGIMQDRKMPVNLTFAGKSGHDDKLLSFAFAFENKTARRVAPPLTPGLVTDKLVRRIGVSRAKGIEMIAKVDASKEDDEKVRLSLKGTLSGDVPQNAMIEVYLDGAQSWSGGAQGTNWDALIEYKKMNRECLGWDLKPLPPKPIMVLVVAKAELTFMTAKLLWVPI